MGFLREMLSENGGVPSTKRVIGSLSYLTCLVCMVILVIREGGSFVVESLIQTVLITATSLLGISSVTSIWKQGKNTSSVSTSETSKRSSKKMLED